MTDNSIAIPGRFRWLKRLTIASIILLFMLVGLRWYWGYTMDRRLSAAVAAIQQRGEPIHLQDYAQPPIPDADNKAYYLQQALANWPRVDGQVITQTAWYADPDQYEDPIADNAAYLKQCQQVVELLRKAEQAPACDWGVVLVTPAIQIQLPHLPDVRELARLLGDAATRAHQAGNDRLAVDLIELHLVVADATHAPPHSLISYLVAVSLREKATKQIESISFTLQIDTAQQTAAQPSQVQQLMSKLLDDDAYRRSFIDALVGERVQFYDMIMASIDGRIPLNAVATGPFVVKPDWLSLFLFEPLYRRDASLLLELYSARVDTARHASTYWHFEQGYASRVPDWTAIDKHPQLYPISASFFVPFEHTSPVAFRIRTQCQLAAVALAIRLYQVDHDGRRPATLSELVPEYLDAVPRDLFALVDQPIGYKPDGGTPSFTDPNAVWPETPKTEPAALADPQLPILYSVGIDGVDNNGLMAIRSNAQWQTEAIARYMKGADHWFLLAPLPAARTTASPSGQSGPAAQTQPDGPSP